MFVWIILALCAVVSTADLPPSILGESNASELPGPSGSQPPTLKDFEVHDLTTEAPSTTEELSTTDAPSTTEELSTTDAPSTTAALVPQRPVFNRSMHVRYDLLSTPDSVHKISTYDIQYHAESNTALVSDGGWLIYRIPSGDGKVQYLEADFHGERTFKKFCEMSPSYPASPLHTSCPYLNFESYSFVGYKTEESRRVEHWRRVVIGKPGQYEASPGESLNYTYSFFIYRDGEDAVPLRHEERADSSVEGPNVEWYALARRFHDLLPAPTSPLIPDTDKLCYSVKPSKKRTKRSVRERPSK